MKWFLSGVLRAVLLSWALLLPLRGKAAGTASTNVASVVAQVITPVMKQYGIPGMAVGVFWNGAFHVYDYGVASTTTRQPVNTSTLFEIGSISKIFNATLAAYAQENGMLSLSDIASAYLPALRGSAFDQISLLDLGTYTPGGMPLQVPDGINDDAQLIAYFKTWKAAYKPGTMRTYSNLSIGLLGFITARSMNADYAALLQDRMFPALGLKRSFMDIPADQAGNYAQGYEDDGTPIRMAEGVLAPETYGVRTTAGDLLRFLVINIGIVGVDAFWRRAVLATHTGYFQTGAGGMVQDLVWEQYKMPVTLAALQAGDGYGVIQEPNPVTSIIPPLPPRMEVLLDKTGSTNGFGAYVAFVPAARIAVVLLANKNYPIPARISAAYQILSSCIPGLHEATVGQ